MLLKPYVITYNGKKLKLEKELKDNNINEYNILNNKIAIIDSGINYLHPDFINSDGSSKIISIWDQESKIGKPPNNINLGSEFKKEEINEYTKLKDDSLTKDLTGTGTIAAGICSGNGNINSLYKGISPRSELVIVKLREYEGIYKDGIKSYELSDFLLAVKYIIEISKNYKKLLY